MSAQDFDDTQAAYEADPCEADRADYQAATWALAHALRRSIEEEERLP